MLLVVFLLFVAGILVATHFYIPVLFEKFQDWHAMRAQQTSLQLEDAFVFVGGKKLRRMSFLFFGVLGILGFVTNGFIGLAVGAAMGVILPSILTKTLIKKRKDKFGTQLIDTLMIVSSCLKGGLTLVQSFESVMEEMPPPISDEFGLVVRETKVGVSLEESLRKLNNRMRSDDMDLIISSILVARETGGDLTKVFSGLINTIRDRIEIKEMANTLTLQGRIQGIIMSMIPVFFVGIIKKFNPNHFDAFLKDDIGRMLIMAAVVMQILAFFFIKKFSTVRV